METKQNPTYATEFAKEVHEGLTAFPKYLSSKYFYDQKGDKLFQQIMELPEYYLTGCEHEILSTYKEELFRRFTSAEGFDLIELGAGDGQKTKILLGHFIEQQADFKYKPIDISPDVLEELEDSVKKTWPALAVETQQGSYFDVLDALAETHSRKKIIMVLGSNIGNLKHPEAIKFLRNINDTMQEDDVLFMGFDQKKSPELIRSAYNDSKGVTEAFNKNILARINRELNADFDLDAFVHWPTYDPETGTTKSFLVSTKAQEVNLNALNLSISLEPWESIHTEISQKYDDGIVEWLAKEAGLKVTHKFEDKKKYFKDYLFAKGIH